MRPMTQWLCVSGALVMIAVAPAITAQSAPACAQGYVWRDAFPGDGVCVTPTVRAQAAEDNREAMNRREPGGGAYGPDTCRSGYVWRGARDGDAVCVTPETRDQVARDNAAAASRVQSIGSAIGAAMGGPASAGAATASAGSSSPPAAPSRSNGRCRQYARSAVDDFKIMQEKPKCRIATDGRWNANFDGHYDWCMTAQSSWMASERKARDQHLLSCGGRFTL